MWHQILKMMHLFQSRPMPPSICPSPPVLWNPVWTLQLKNLWYTLKSFITFCMFAFKNAFCYVTYICNITISFTFQSSRGDETSAAEDDASIPVQTNATFNLSNLLLTTPLLSLKPSKRTPFETTLCMTFQIMRRKKRHSMRLWRLVPNVGSGNWWTRGDMNTPSR